MKERTYDERIILRLNWGLALVGASFVLNVVQWLWK